VAGYSGLRWAELVGLRRRHVDLAGARVHVVEQAAEVAGKIVVGPPKTEAGRRVVTLPAVAAKALAEHLDRYAQPGLDGLRFHDLRHTAGTLAAVAGATTKELMERIGHTSPGVTLRYQHVMADRQAALAAALDGLTREATSARRRARGGHGQASGTKREGAPGR
jgi:integrase